MRIASAAVLQSARNSINEIVRVGAAHPSNKKENWAELNLGTFPTQDDSYRWETAGQVGTSGFCTER
jgi:hypothetical protein